MKIEKNHIPHTSIPAEPATAPAAPAPSGAGSADAAPGSRGDRVSISSSARARISGAVPFGAVRIAEIRAKIVDGTYDSPAIAHETARRIQASGDLR